MAFQQALSARLFHISRRHEPPFFSASAADESLTSSVDSFVLTAQALEGGTLVALEALLTEVGGGPVGSSGCGCGRSSGRARARLP
jgi:hypothetical protein